MPCIQFVDAVYHGVVFVVRFDVFFSILGPLFRMSGLEYASLSALDAFVRSMI